MNILPVFFHVALINVSLAHGNIKYPKNKKYITNMVMKIPLKYKTQFSGQNKTFQHYATEQCILLNIMS